jgi:hypothetical protein
MDRPLGHRDAICRWLGETGGDPRGIRARGQFSPNV